jgi:hypothetical protein
MPAFLFGNRQARDTAVALFPGNFVVSNGALAAHVIA